MQLRSPRPLLGSVAPGLVTPWWIEVALAEEVEAEPAPPLQGEAEADVAIVGGGYTGLWTALALHEREPGLRIVVLEADECGFGPSGRNGGFVHGYWGYLPRLRARFGDEGALAVARAAEEIVPAIRAFCERRGEDVWLREGGMLRVSAAPAQDTSVEQTVAAARQLGVEQEAVPLSAEELAERIRSPRFRRGVFVRDCATVQPARLARALRRAAQESCSVHEHTRVTAIRPGLLETPKGRVSAEEIVVAVNAAAAGWKPLARQLTVFGSYVVLTEPAPKLLEGSGSGPIGIGGRLDERFTRDGATAARAEAGLRRLLPELAGARITHAWGGPVDRSSDHLPFF